MQHKQPRQGLHGEGPVPPLAAEGSYEATVRLDNTSIQEAWESIKGQDIAQRARGTAVRGEGKGEWGTEGPWGTGL